jgi:integrase
MGRTGNRQSSVYLGKDGHWHGRVTVGRKDDGSLDRRHVMSKSKGTVVAKVRALERLRDEARVPKAGRAWTVEKWLLHWLEEIARPNIRDSSYQAYRTAITKHLLPVIGSLRLDRLEPEQIEAVHRRMAEAGARPATVHQVHRTLRTALGEAERRAHLGRNPAQPVRPPRIQPEPVEPFTVEEVQRLLAAAQERRNAARWAIALALGLRQGEALALRWEDIDLEAKALRVRATRLRPVYEHGCDGDCEMAAGYCPRRRQTNGIVGATKSAAGNRVVGLPVELVALLKDHRRKQLEERIRAGSLWQEGGWVFTTLIGRPIAPNSDYHEWRALLESAGVRHARLHDARHTAATVLLVLGVPERTVMSIMGWSSTSMAARYQHVTDPIRREVASRVGGLLFGDRRDSDSTGSP